MKSLVVTSLSWSLVTVRVTMKVKMDVSYWSLRRRKRWSSAMIATESLLHRRSEEDLCVLFKEIQKLHCARYCIVPRP